jgi:dolichol kinase
VADSAASLAGRRFGKTPVMGKTVEGSLAFLLAALIVIVIIGQILSPPPHYYAGGAAAAVAGTLAELCCGVLHADDNLGIPLAAGGVMSLVMALL